MSKSLYTIRGFKPFSEQSFDTTGVLEKFASFETKTVEKQHEAIVELLTGSIGVSARTLTSVSNSLLKNLVDVRTDKTVPADEVIIINLTLSCNIDKHDLRDVRPLLVDSFTRWAEKSRVRGSRGWRVSAIRTPVFEKEKGSIGYLMKVQILLSNAVFYNQDTVKVGINLVTVRKDFENLKRHINNTTGGICDSLLYTHSVVGAGLI